MGKKVRWFDAVQRILSTSSEPDGEEKEDKPERVTSKSSLRKLWQFGRSSASNSSSSAATGTDPAPHQQPPPQPAVAAQAESAGTTSEQNNDGHPVAALASCIAAAVTQAAEAVTSATAILTPRAPASSEEELAAVKIQTACRGYLAREGYQARARARLMSLLEGVAVKRQTEEALYCMQTMTRVQTQIHARRVKKVEDKRALKNQQNIQPKQGLEKTKIGEGWDHTQQSKEQTEATLAMKQEAATRRQRALSYAFSNQWRNRRTSSSSGRRRVAPVQSHPPTFMDPGCPNWGWSWAERWTAAARPWESQTAPQDKDPAKGAGRAAKPRASISVQVPTTPTGRSARSTVWPSSSPSTPTRPRSPSVTGKTNASPRPTRSPRGRSGSTLSERPKSSQEHLGGSSGGGGGDEKEAALRRTSSLRAGELPRKLNLGARDVGATETDVAPVTPSYMQPTKSVRAKARCASPAAAGSAEQSPRTPPPVSSPSVKRRVSQELAEKQWVSSSPRTPRTQSMSQEFAEKQWVSSSPRTQSMSQELAEKQWVSSSPRTPRTPGTPSKAKADIRARRPPSPRSS